MVFCQDKPLVASGLYTMYSHVTKDPNSHDRKEMTTNRNILEDQRKTNEKLLDIRRHADKNGKNWLGHRALSGADTIDKLLLTGAGIEELCDTNRTTRSSVEKHLHHLQNEHGLTITRQTILRFVPSKTK